MLGDGVNVNWTVLATQWIKQTTEVDFLIIEYTFKHIKYFVHIVCNKYYLLTENWQAKKILLRECKLQVI